MAEEQQQQGNIKVEFNTANTGLNLDQSVNQIPKGTLTYALNAAVENFDSNSVNYQNEPGNELCLDFPPGYQLIGEHSITEKNKHIFFLANPETGASQIGYMINNDCQYRVLISAPCLNFNINHPIHKVVHKITNCTEEIYWTDGFNSRRWLDLLNVPYVLRPGTSLCDASYTDEVDCNQLKIQPNFEIPELSINNITTGGDLQAGAYQFAIQYANANGEGYTSYYSVTNPTPIANTQLTTPDFNYQVGRSIVIDINNLDGTGLFQYFNLAVIKTINGITSVELVGTYFIDRIDKQLIYTGQNQTQIRLTVSDIFEKYPYYDIAEDLTAVRDILVWDNLISVDRISYQQIANQITLQWQTYRLPAGENYADGLNATNYRGYVRDEVYAFEIVFLLKNGKQTDGFHIPGRVITAVELNFPAVPTTNSDFVGTPDYYLGTTGYSPYWKIYNTASVTGFSPQYVPNDPTYKGPYQYGEFAYWESTDTYPCNTEVWGELANQKIRHHKFPDVLVSPHYESALFTGANSMVMQNDAIFPMGVNIDVQQVSLLIQQSGLTKEQKDDIVAFKIIRGDRAANKSIVAKGILRNVGKYTREETDYYYPNYPYNDLNIDPFLLSKSNSFTVDSVTASQSSNSSGICRSFHINVTVSGRMEYIDCYTNNIVNIAIVAGEDYDFCANSIPRILTGTATLYSNTYTIYKITARGAYFKYTPPSTGCYQPNGELKSPPAGWPSWQAYCSANPTNSCCSPFPTEISRYISVYNVLTGQYIGIPSYISSITYPKYDGGDSNYTIEIYKQVGFDKCSPEPLNGFSDENLKYRQIFNSPETAFAQPFLGDILKIENVMFGAGRSHFVQVKKNSMYRLVSKEAQQDALKSATDIANITTPGDAVALFAAYQAYLTIYVNGIPRRNYGWSFNSIANYDYGADVNNNTVDQNGKLGIKQRKIKLAQYIIPGVQSVGDSKNINNYQRETSVFIKTDEGTTASPITSLPFPSKTPNLLDPSGNSIVSDNSRYTLSDSKGDCNNPGRENPINVVSYYASLKNTFVNQWGQIYSYETVDTGFQRNIEITSGSKPIIATFFGGDTFISRFTFKTKLPFFIDNRVGAPDESDIYYDELGNLAYPRYWYSARSVLSDVSVALNGGAVNLTNFISYKAHNLDCPNTQTPNSAAAPNPGRTYYDGKMYLFAYGIPNFYCETSYNLDLRQAFNNREGDFWPHVSTGIPDDWVQESFVPIAQDNTYYYNVSFSRQNRENFFSHLPVDWKQQLCFTNYPFRAIYSDTQEEDPTGRTNNWLSYRPISFFDFPQNYGGLTSLDGIQNKAVLARFENKSLLYNTLLTVNTSNPQAAYLGNNTLFSSSPAIDFAETDLGYVGSQNKFLLKIPQGQITIDAKRGQVFLIGGIGGQITDLSAFGSGMNRFFTDHLAFEILRYFPTVDIDNHFNGIGLHGVYDSKFDRVIITKLDYIPLSKDVVYDDIDKNFYLERIVNDETLRTQIYLSDVDYFCNKSWTLSFNMNTKSWISFHSYIPNFYIAENNFFYSGLNGCCGDDAAAFQIAASIIVPTTTTTSTSSTSTSTSTTTSTTTATPLDCVLDGDAVEKDCRLAGDAFDLTPTTTTTTSSSTSTTSTTTTLASSCQTFQISVSNIASGNAVISYTDCSLVSQSITIGPDEIQYICAILGTISCSGVGCPYTTINVWDNTGCNIP